jgi:hypothetical protein
MNRVNRAAWIITFFVAIAVGAFLAAAVGG